MVFVFWFCGFFFNFLITSFSGKRHFLGSEENRRAVAGRSPQSACAGSRAKAFFNYS